jgi:Flp pilus assembly protein TadD
VFSTQESLMRDTLQKNPDASGAHNDLGVILAERQDIAGATAHFMAAVQSNPENAGAQLNLGQALALTGRFPEAEPHFLAAISLQPDDAPSHKRFADALRHQGRNAAALSHYQTAVCLSRKPDVQTRLELASLLYQTGKPGPAVSQYRKILLSQPDMLETLNNLAWLLATCSDDSVRDGVAAVQYAEHACQLTAYNQGGYLSTLAAAYAEAGRFPDAVTTANQAIKLQTASGQSRSAAINQQFLQLYSAGQPYHEPPPATPTE